MLTCFFKYLMILDLLRKHLIHIKIPHFYFRDSVGISVRQSMDEIFANRPNTGCEDHISLSLKAMAEHAPAGAIGDRLGPMFQNIDRFSSLQNGSKSRWR